MFTNNGKSLIIVSIILLLQGVLFLTIGTFFAKPSWEALYWQKKGTPDQGMIVKIINSNTRINNVLQKNVVIQFQGHENIMKTVPPSRLSGLAIGKSVPIRYNKKDPRQFRMDYPITAGILITNSIFPIIGLIILSIGLFFFTKYRSTKERYEYIRCYGQSTNGKILSIANGTLRVNNVQYQTIELEFLGKQQVAKNINPRKIIGLSVGDEIEIKYDSQNQENFILVEKDKLLSFASKV